MERWLLVEVSTVIHYYTQIQLLDYQVLARSGTESPLPLLVFFLVFRLQ